MLNINIYNIIRIYLLPLKSIIELNKRICLNQLKLSTHYIEYDLNSDQVVLLEEKNKVCGIIKCKNYNNAKYYNDIKFGWIIVSKYQVI